MTTKLTGIKIHSVSKKIMESLTISSHKKNKPLKAQIVDDGDILLQFDEDTFGNFISNLLKEKQLLEKKYKGAILLTHTDLIEFYHLIYYKFKSQSNILSDTASIRVYYNTGERHVLHSIEEIEKYNEPRNIVPVRVNLNFKCFIKDIEKNKVYHTDISIVVQTIEGNPYGEISLVIQHNDRLFASEIIHILEPLIQRVIQKPTIYQNSYLLIKKINLHILWILFAIVMSTILIFSFYTYTPVSGITELSQKSIDLLKEGRECHREFLNINMKYYREMKSYSDALEKLNLNIDPPGTQFQDLLLDNEMITSEDINLSLLVLSYVEKIRSYGEYDSRLFSYILYGGSVNHDTKDILYVKNDKYILPDNFNKIDRFQNIYHFNGGIADYIKNFNDKVLNSLERLTNKRYMSEKYKEFLQRYLDMLRNNLLYFNTHLDKIIKLPERYNPIIFKIQDKTLKLKVKLSEKPTYTVTSFTKYIFILFFFSLPIFFFLHLLNDSKSFLSLNSYTKNLEKSRDRKQLAFKVSLFGTIVVSIGCSLFASGVYDFLSYLFRTIF